MKNLTGYGLTVFVLAIAVASVSALVYAIQARANELIYYRELSKYRTQFSQDVVLCGGPSNLTCQDGETCEVSKTSEAGVGKCVPIESN